MFLTPQTYNGLKTTGEAHFSCLITESTLLGVYIYDSMQQCSALAWYRAIQILRMGKSLAAHGLG